MPDLDYWVKWAGIMALPIGCWFFLLLSFAGKICFQRARGETRTTDRKKRTQFSSIIALFLMSFYYLYLAVTRRALDIFNCNPSNPKDGYLYVSYVS